MKGAGELGAGSAQWPPRRRSHRCSDEREGREGERMKKLAGGLGKGGAEERQLSAPCSCLFFFFFFGMMDFLFLF